MGSAEPSSLDIMRGGARLDPDTTMGGPHGQFPSTQLSLLEAASSGAGLPNEALERVSALYWKPVYRFIRITFRKNNEDAKDLTQGFFAAASERDFFARFDPAKASFRTYLRMAVERFAAGQHAAQHRQKGGGGVRAPRRGAGSHHRIARTGLRTRVAAPVVRAGPRRFARTLRSIQQAG